MNGPRQVSLDYHLAAGREWLRYGRDKQLPTPLMYAALEFRMAMERFVLELLVCLKDQLEPAHVEGRSVKQIIETVADYASDPTAKKSQRKARLQRALQFNRLVTEHINATVPQFGKPLYTPDLDDIIDFWKRLSDYCHARVLDVFADPANVYVPQGYGLLEEILAYMNVILREHQFGGMPVETMPPETRTLRDRYLTGDIDDAGVRRSLELMEPVLTQRQRDKKD